MSHGAQEKRLRDVRKIFEIVSSRKTSQEENEELSARNFLANKCCWRDSNPHTPALHLCDLTIALQKRKVEKKFPKLYSDIEIKIFSKLAQKRKHENYSMLTKRWSQIGMYGQLLIIH